MLDLTLQQVDAAIRRAAGDTGVGYERRIALAVLNLAANMRIELGVYHEPEWRNGVEAKNKAIRATVKRLRKEAKGNG